MRISTKGRYSLEALLYLALLKEGQFASTRKIGNDTGLSDGYLEQLFIPLRQAGIVTGVRGPQGGYIPGKPLAEISVGDVLRAVEGSLEPVDCLSSRKCPAHNKCVSRHTWKELYSEISDCVNSISMQDMVDAYQKMDDLEYML